MRFEGEFRVPGHPDKVLEAFGDVERMVKCMPGAGLDGRDDEGNYLGHMVVAFGPKKIRFKGKIQAVVDPAALRGSLQVRGAAEMRMTAPAEVQVNYIVKADPAATTPVSVVSLVSEAELGGVLADFARTGGLVVTQALMDMFAERLVEEFSHSDPATTLASTAPLTNAIDQPVSTAAPAARAPVAPTSFSAGRLLWLVIKGRLFAWTRWMRAR